MSKNEFNTTLRIGKIGEARVFPVTMGKECWRYVNGGRCDRWHDSTPTIGKADMDSIVKLNCAGCPKLKEGDPVEIVQLHEVKTNVASCDHSIYGNSHHTQNLLIELIQNLSRYKTGKLVGEIDPLCVGGKLKYRDGIGWYKKREHAYNLGETKFDKADWYHFYQPYNMWESAMIVYLLSEIERRQIVVRSIFAFTNGTIQDPHIREAFERCARYIAKVDTLPAVQDIPPGRDIPERHVYKGIVGKMVGIVVSTDNDRFHKNSHVVGSTIEFYREIKNSNFCIMRQDKELGEDRLSCIILEGNTERNYKTLLLEKEYIQRVRRINNKFNIMQPEGDSVWWINKSISISSNGNVHPGCMMPYTKIDADPMFNIMDCQNNFFEKVEEWCWKHPIWPQQHKQRETYEAYLWCKERGIKFLQDIRPEDEEVEAVFAELTNEFEKTAMRNHQLFPYLTFSEIGALSFCTLATCLYSTKFPVEVFKDYLTSYSDLNSEVIEILTNSSIFKLIKMSMFYTDKNAARAREARFKK